METRANYVLIGLFTLAAIVGAFGFVYWFQNIGAVSSRIPYRIEFNGPVSGLRTGASVVFNGIRVGEVSSVSLDDPRKVVANVLIDRSAPVRQDTDVGLEFQGLTGIASVSLRGGLSSAPQLVTKPGEVPTLIARSNTNLDVTEEARATLQRMNVVIEENQQALRNSLRNIETFTQTLAKNSERIDNILAGIEVLTGGKDGKGELQDAARSIKDLAENLDRRAAAFINDGRRAVNTIDRAVKNFDRNPTRVIFGGQTVFPEKKPERR